LSPTGCVVYVSPAWERLAGWAPEALVGVDSDDLVHPDERSEAARLRRAVVRDDRPLIGSFRLRCVDGRYLWAEGLFSPVVHPHDPERPLILCTMRNVEERKLAEA
jgi:PAS domain S-box-containing protein